MEPKREFEDLKCSVTAQGSNLQRQGDREHKAIIKEIQR